MKFSILIYGSEAVTSRMSEEEQERVLDKHRALQDALAERGAYAVARLMPTSSAVTLRSPGPDAKPLLVDGPFSETKERFLGFYVADFVTLEEAAAFAERISSPLYSLELRPVSWSGGVLAEPETV